MDDCAIFEFEKDKGVHMKSKRNQYVYFPYCKKYIKDDENIKKSCNDIFKDLEKYGRSFTANGKASHKLSYAMKQANEKGFIRFTWDKKSDENRSTIVLKPGIKLKRVSDRKIRFDVPQKTKVIKPKLYKERLYRE